MKELFDFDNSFYHSTGVLSGFLAGLDEAGRGPLAGPVVSAAVILKKNININKLNDSKKLSPLVRLSVYKEIIQNAVDWKIGIVDHQTIDRINILEAAKLSMKIAAEKLSIQPELILIDGNQQIDVKINQKAIVNGDSKSASIAAASIIAKVTRDLLMEELDKKFPNYGFSKHKGYGTKYHINAIKTYGPCEIHRKSFKPVRVYGQNG
ncbi:MAG: ribonuclease HII [Elusimicrobia bacterium]|nr:ribonuclease HII [Elusimicrobiota bacterium]